MRGLFDGAVILRDMGPGGGITFRPESIIIDLASISPLNRLRSGLPLQALVSTAMTWLCISAIPIQNEGLRSGLGLRFNGDIDARSIIMLSGRNVIPPPGPISRRITAPSKSPLTPRCLCEQGNDVARCQ